MSSNNEFPNKNYKKYIYQKSPNTYNYKISENSQINRGGYIYIDNITIYSDIEIDQNNENNNESNDNKNKVRYKNKVYNINNDSNLNNSEKVIEHLYSFRPNEINNSRKYYKIAYDFQNDEDEMKSNYDNYYNYNNNKNLKIFSEKVEAKIEKDNKNNKNKYTKNNNNDKEKLIVINATDNINDNYNNNDIYNNNHFVNFGKLYDKNKNNRIDSEEIEKQKGEEFQMKEVLKIKRMKKIIDNKDENRKENAFEKEDNSQDINLNMNNKKNNILEYSRFSKNKENSNRIISPSQTNIPTLRETKEKEKSFKLSEDFIKSPKLNKGYKKNIDLFNNINNINDNKNNNLNKYEYIKNRKNKEIKEEIKTNQGSPNNKITNKVYEISNIKKKEIKNNKNNQKLYSPNKNNIKVNNIKKVNTNSNLNLSSDKKEPKASSSNIYNNKNNLLKNQNIYSKNNLINQGDSNKKEKKLYNNSEGKEKKISFKKKKLLKLNEKNLEAISKPRTTEYQQIKFPYTPRIDKNNKAIREKRNRRSKKNLKRNKENSESNSNKKYKIPKYDLLNEYKINSREKIKEKYLTQDEQIKINSSLKKISNNSYKFAIKRMIRKIENIINIFKIQKDEKLSFIQIVQCLCTMRIINELIKTENIKDLNLKTFKNITKEIKEKDKKKLEELEFLEQFWFILNPTLEEFINYKLFSKIVKILFLSDYSKIKISTNDINNLLEENKIKLQNNTKGIFISPFRENALELKDIWQISKLIKIFLKLKSDLMDYKNNYSEIKKEQFKNELMKEREKEFLFHPNINKSNFIFKTPKYNY